MYIDGMIVEFKAEYISEEPFKGMVLDKVRLDKVRIAGGVTFATDAYVIQCSDKGYEGEIFIVEPRDLLKRAI